MNNKNTSGKIFSRRDFLNISVTSFSAIGLQSLLRPLSLVDFPQSERLGRVAVGKVDVKNRPDEESSTLDVLYEDSVVTWLRETIGNQPFRVNQKWVETPDGYIWSPHVQPVLNQLNIPVITFSISFRTSSSSGIRKQHIPVLNSRTARSLSEASLCSTIRSTAPPAPRMIRP